MKTLFSRVAIAAALLPISLGVVWLGGWWLFAVALIAGLIALHEFWQMTRPLRPLALAGYLGAVLAILGAHLGGVDWALAGFLATFGLALLLNGVAETRGPATAAIGVTVLGAGWVGLGLAHVILVRQLPHHARLAVLTVLLAVVASDSVAYAAGRLLGRHKLAPALSPGKTWEGLVAGTAAAIFVGFVALYPDRHHFLSVWQALVLGAAVAVAAPLGDLFESALKRDMQVKDTGRLLGSHGGVLDRIDSVLFAGVAAYYLFRAFGAGN